MDAAVIRACLVAPLALGGCRAVAPDERPWACAEARCSETGETTESRDPGETGETGETGEASTDSGDTGSCVPTAEVPYDGIDQDCDGHDLTDVDGDGFDAAGAGGDDCDDTDPSVHLCRCPATGRSPERWALDVARDAEVWVEADFDTATVHADSFLVYGDVSGFLPGTVSVTAGRAEFVADRSAQPGERLTAVLTGAVLCTNGDPAGPLVWTWTAAVDGGTGVLESAGEIATGLDYSYGIVAHDLDGDGDLEVATADAQGNTVSIFDGEPGALSLVQSITIENYPNYLQGADVERDGDVDLVVVTYAGLEILQNDGTGAFADPVAFSTSPYVVLTSLRAAELDGDGDLDLVLSATADDALVVMLNDGSGAFAVAGEVEYSNANANPFPLGVGDIDNDDDIDVILPLEFENRVSVLLNDGAAGFSEHGSVPTGGQPKAVVLNDLDGDGDADAVVPSLSGDVDTLLGDGTGVFSTATLPLIYVHGACGGDLDGDGDIDVAVPTFYQFTVQSLLNDGSGTFHVDQTFTTTRPGTSVFCADLDGDGALDVLLASGAGRDSSVTAYLNTP